MAEQSAGAPPVLVPMPPRAARAFAPRRRAHDSHLSPMAMNLQGLVYALVVFNTLYAIAALADQPFTLPYRVMAAIAAALAFLGMRTFSLMAPWKLGRSGSDGNRVMLTWCGVVGALLLLGYVTKCSSYFSRHVLLLWFVLTPAALTGVHVLARWATRRAMPDFADGRRAVMVFANDTARRFAASARRSKNFIIDGYFEDRAPERCGRIGRLPRLGGTDELARYVREHDIPVVFIFLSFVDSARARALIEALSDTTASIYYVPDFQVLGDISTRLASFESMPMLEVFESPFSPIDALMKRLFDLALATLALLALALPLAVIAVLVKLSSPGPVLFTQKRYGLNGREFRIYKFRSMREAPDADMRQATRDDARVTPVGRVLRRSSLDELPQLFNVLRGEMSLVGPRPHTVAHNEFYRKLVRCYMVRHKVKPGITGLAQVEGFRGETVQLELMQQRVQHDMLYISNWSPGLDLKIILRTIGLVLRGDQHAY